jgi:DNA-binding NarL/FixJ family response regulator
MPKLCEHAAAMDGKHATHTKVLVVEDHRMFAQALCAALEREDGIEARAVHSGREALTLLPDFRPHVVLMDVMLPGEGGVEVTRQVREIDHDIVVVMLSAYDDDVLKSRSLEAGATGYLPKTASLDTVVQTIRLARQGEPLMEPDEVDRLLRRTRRRRWEDASEVERADRLTPREREILQLMADGLAPPEVVERLGISRHTLRTHMQNVLTKLGVHTKTQALMVAIRHGKVAGRT